MGLEGKEIEIKVLVLPLNFTVSTFPFLKNYYNMVRVGHCFFVFFVFAVVVVKDFFFKRSFRFTAKLRIRY